MTNGAAGIVLALALAACAADEDHPGHDAASLDAGPRDAVLVDPAQYDEPGVYPPCEPTAESLLTNVFQVGCGGSACHGEGTPAWDLLLVDPGADKLLVDVPAYGCIGWVRVSPGSLERSFLYQKVTQATPPCGHRMPWGSAPLPSHSLACIAGWITALGADASAADGEADRPDTGDDG